MASGTHAWERSAVRRRHTCLKKLNIKVLCDPTIPLLGMNPKESKTGMGREICTSMFLPALFTIAKVWKQPKCPSGDEWIKCGVHIHPEY